MGRIRRRIHNKRSKRKKDKSRRKHKVNDSMMNEMERKEREEKGREGKGREGKGREGKGKNIKKLVPMNIVEIMLRNSDPATATLAPTDDGQVYIGHGVEPYFPRHQPCNFSVVECHMVAISTSAAHRP